MGGKCAADLGLGLWRCVWRLVSSNLWRSEVIFTRMYGKGEGRDREAVWGESRGV